MGLLKKKQPRPESVYATAPSSSRPTPQVGGAYGQFPQPPSTQQINYQASPSPVPVMSATVYTAVAAAPAPNLQTRPVSTQPAAADPFAPRFYNVSQKSNLYQRVVLVHGGAGPQNTQFDASITVHHHLAEFPPLTFPVADGYFKALVHLSPGSNDLRFVFNPPPGMGSGPSSSNLQLNYTPLLQNAPLHLAIMVARDSEFKFDSPPAKTESEGNGLEAASRKLRVAGYLMQAFTGEQMSRNGMGRRTFRLDEEWAPDTLSRYDGRSRMTAKIHVIRSDKTMKEIRDADVAQQNDKGKDTGGLFDYALNAIRKHGGPFAPTPTGEDTHVAVLILDSKWDPKRNLIRGHAAIGGGSEHIKLAIFGSHSTYSWPSHIEDVVSCFSDTTPADTRIIADDCNESGQYFKAANVGIGAFMHEVGHLLGCPHQTSGVMLRDYVRLNRTFCVREPISAEHRVNICLPKDECGWNRLDMLRFRCHPMFRLPAEPIIMKSRPAIFPVENGAIATSATGIYLIELHYDGLCRAHLEYPDGPQKEVFLFEEELRTILPDKYKMKQFSLLVLGLGEQQIEIGDFSALVRSSRTDVGRAPMFDSILPEADAIPSTAAPVRVLFRQIRRIRIYHGQAVDGLEFFFESGSAMFGNRGGSPSDFVFEPTEQLIGFQVRSGAWVDAVQIITNLRRSAVYGNTKGGSATDIIPPRGYAVVGVHGYVMSWLTRIGIIYAGTEYLSSGY
ncbi:putative peptidase family-domain-containing protein [Myxozyma melibiosi]|uniref:Peptidase family-domain-containing protein n=1 Tax=Myxozyma melibiosi TaxID=54550 RepID=A0ABR1FAP1_9ASCO